MLFESFQMTPDDNKKAVFLLKPHRIRRIVAYEKECPQPRKSNPNRVELAASIDVDSHLTIVWICSGVNHMFTSRRVSREVEAGLSVTKFEELQKGGGFPHT